MNYYERHLGDYTRDTAHLSLLEHGVYTILLDRYYITEHGIPDAQKYRLARARTRAERQAVNVVLNEFFTLKDGIWINNRAEEEIAATRHKITTAKVNGGKGGRPPKNETRMESETQPKENPTKTQTKPNENPTHNPNETQTKAHQSPDTRYIPTNISLSQDLKVLGPVNNVERQDRHVAIAVMLRNMGMKSITSSHPQAFEWAANDRVTDEILRSAVEKATIYKPISSLTPAYLKPIVDDFINPNKTQTKPIGGIHAARQHVSDQLTGRARIAADEARTVEAVCVA